MAVLYCIGHTGFLLKALVHKFTYHPEEELILVLNSTLYRLKLGGIEKQVYRGRFRNIDEYLTEETLFSDWDEKLKKIDFSEVENIYVMFDVFNYAAFYFEKMGYKYSLIELASNQLFRDSYAKSWQQYSGELIQNNIALLEKYNILTSQGKNCVKYFLHPLTENTPDEEIPRETFYYSDLLLKLDRKYIDKFFGIYPLPELPKEKINIILVNSDGYTRNALQNYNRTSFAGTLINLPYQLLADYYLPDSNVVIKEHPNGRVLGGKKDFPHVKHYIKGDFPSDLMQFCGGLRIDTAIAVSSTAIEHVEPVSENVVRLGRDYFAFSSIINQMYVWFTFFEMIKEHFSSFCYRNIETDQFDNFFKYAVKADNPFTEYVDSTEKLKKTFMVVNLKKSKKEMTTPVFKKIKGADNISAVVFIGAKETTKKEYLLTRTSRKAKVITIKINKTPERDNPLINMDDEEIFILTNNADILEKAKIFAFKKILKHTGIVLEISVSEN